MLVFLLFFLNTSISQVGINTTTPNANSSLDVNGRVVIQDLSRTSNGLTGVKLLLVEANGTLISASVSSGVISENGSNEIIVSNESNVATKDNIILLNEDFDTVNNWDIGLDGSNSDVIVFIIRKGSGDNLLKIRGITGGTNGRRIKIINDSGHDIKFDEDHSNASDGNKIYIFTERNKMKEYGTCELIYSTDISSGNGHWCIVQLDRYTN